MDNFSIVVSTIVIVASAAGFSLSYWLRSSHPEKTKVLDLRAGALSSAFDQTPNATEGQVLSVSDVDGLFEQELLLYEEDHSEYILRKIRENSTPSTTAVRIDERSLDEKPIS